MDNHSSQEGRASDSTCQIRKLVGEQTLPERDRQASMSWQAASAAVSSSSENASGGIRSMREKRRRSLCGGHSSYRATTRFATACSRRTRFQRALLGRLVQSGPSWMQRGSTRRMRWHAADSNGLRREMGELVCIEDRGKKKERRQKEKRSGNRSASHLVARSRFELLISALRGRRPKPLDERARWLG